MEPRDFKAELGALLEDVRKTHGLTLEELNVWVTDAVFVWFGEQVEDEE